MHISQPLDTCMFKPLETEWNKATHMFQSKNLGYRSQNIAIKRGMGECSNICAGFRNAGIYPLNKEKVQPTIENDELLTGIYKSVNIIQSANDT